MSHTEQTEQQEEGIEIPLDRINPDLLQKMIEEFVTREWCELSDSGYTMEQKIEQVRTLLKNKRAKVVFDSTSETWNIVPCK